jgi:nucleotide-binding universal stress UspA family protein
MDKGLIVVGLDGSEPSKAALRWALEEARLRGSAVRVVYAWFAYPALVPGAPLLASDWESLRRSAEEYMEEIVGSEVEPASELDVTAVAVHGTAADVLVRQARGAEMLVVGSRGHGGFAGLLLGSVSQQCVQHAPCPVVIVRGTEAGVDAAEPRERDVAVPV